MQLWLRYGYRSMLAPGNLPALCANFNVHVIVCTAEADAAEVRARCPFEVLVGDTNARPSKYNLMSAAHNEALKIAHRNDWGVIFGLADSFYADGTFAEVGRLIKNGKRAVLTQGLNVSQQGLPANMPAAVRPRDLVRLAARNLHCRSREQVWNNDQFIADDLPPNPGVMLWRLKEHGFIMRAFHVYPLFLYPERLVRTEVAIDGWDFLGRALSNLDTQCGWLDDSDRGCFIDIAADLQYQDLGNPRVLGPDYVRDVWLPKYTADYNLWAVRRKIWFHDGIERNEWRHIEQQSDAVVEAICGMQAR